MGPTSLIPQLTINLQFFLIKISMTSDETLSLPQVITFSDKSISLQVLVLVTASAIPGVRCE